MINYKCLRKVGPCLFVAESIGKDGETYYLNVSVKRRAYSRIKRTRKRQIAKAKHMMEEYEDRLCEEYDRYPMCEVCGREKAEGIYNGMWMCGECAYEQAYYDTFGRC